MEYQKNVFFFLSLLLGMVSFCRAEYAPTAVQAAASVPVLSFEQQEALRVQQDDQKRFDEKMAEVDALMAKGKYLDAFSRLDEMSYSFSDHWGWNSGLKTGEYVNYTWSSRKNVDSFKNKFLDIIDGVQYERDRTQSSNLAKLEGLGIEVNLSRTASRICDYYIKYHNDSAAAIDLIDRLFTKVLLPSELVPMLLDAHEKNGTLRDGCSKVEKLIDAALDLDSHDWFSAVMVVMALDVVDKLAPFMMKMDSYRTRNFLMSVTQKVFERHLDNIVTIISTIVAMHGQVFTKIAEKFTAPSLLETATTLNPISSVILKMKKQCSGLFKNLVDGFGSASSIFPDAFIVEVIKMPIAVASLMQRSDGISSAHDYMQSIYNDLLARGYRDVAQLLADFAVSGQTPESGETFSCFARKLLGFCGATFGRGLGDDQVKELNYLKQPIILAEA